MRLAVQGLLFDNDGVLVNSLESVERAWGAWSEKYSQGFRIGFEHHGRPAREIVAELVSKELFPLANEEINQLEVDLVHLTKPMPGAIELTASLPKEIWTVVTSAHDELGIGRLRAAGIDVPKNLVTAGDVRQGKPSPEPYLLAAERLGIAIEDCLVFEDAPSGVKAGKAAGAKYVIGVGEEVMDSEADFVISSLVGIRYEAGELFIPEENRLR